MKLRILELWLNLLHASLSRGQLPTPFPSFATYKTNEPNADLLRSIIHTFPSISNLQKNKGGEMISLKKGKFHLELYRFVEAIGKCKKIMFRKNEIRKFMKKYKFPNSEHPPQFIVQLKCNNNNNNNKKEKENVLYAYHGSKLSSFYSILRNGLQQTLPVNNHSGELLYGRGVYFSSKLTVARDFSQIGRCWKGSANYKTLRCVIMCEITKDEKGVFQKDDYIVVRKPQLITQKYLICYSRRDGSSYSLVMVLIVLLVIFLVIPLFMKHRYS